MFLPRFHLEENAPLGANNIVLKKLKVFKPKNALSAQPVSNLIAPKTCTINLNLLSTLTDA